MIIDDLEVLRLVLFALVVDKPEWAFFLYLIEIYVREELLLWRGLATKVAGTSQSFGKQRLGNDWTTRSIEDN